MSQTLTTIEPQTLVRVCAACEEECGLSAVPRPLISHGFCKRHFMAVLRHSGCSAAEIEAAVSEFAEEAFCADLKAPEARLEALAEEVAQIPQSLTEVGA